MEMTVSLVVSIKVIVSEAAKSAQSVTTTHGRFPSIVQSSLLIDRVQSPTLRPCKLL